MPPYIDSHLSRRQQRLAEVIDDLGGYWPPSSAVARILEELGELAEVLSTIESGLIDQSIAEELADLWIITTCLANQFCIFLPESERQKYGEPSTSFDVKDLSLLLVEAGLIARIVNYYDGPKPPRSLEDWVPLGKALRLFHTHLFWVADFFKVDLETAVDQKLDESVIRDKGRFRPNFDPSTAVCLNDFLPVVNRTACTFAPTARLWGAPVWDEKISVVENARRCIPYLIRFTKCAKLEGLDSFVIEMDDLPAGEYGMSALTARFRELLHELASQDPMLNRSFRGPVDRPGWQFSFNGVRLFISVFSGVYAADHPRHSPNSTFVMLQPETSFDHCSVGSAFSQSDGIKKRIRDEFISRDISYPADLIDERIEARLYILPRSEADNESEWWH
jgi:NTP pyrophosphatase (non-canonical NTP hydrolase)